MPDSDAIRQAVRAKRRALPEATARRYARLLARNARKHPLLLNSRHIASFLAADGEMDPLPLMQQLWSLGKKIYLPVLVPFKQNRLWFARFEPGDALVYNRYGIPEPVRRQLIRPAALELVLTPLVAFDARGHRLGMGGGFYDRSFAFLQRRSHWKQPRLLGIAYEFQQQPSISANAWDIPLDAVVTEKTVYTV
jgi:5-formyltetrahydrofolate cyclo-ligase